MKTGNKNWLKRGLRMVALDLRSGLPLMTRRLALLFLVANIFCFMLFCLVKSKAYPLEDLTFADYLAACVGGIAPYSPRNADSFNMPAGWLCLCSFLAFTALEYPGGLNTTGTQSLVALGSRRCWWLCKSLWAIVISGISWAVVVGLCALWSLIDGTAAVEDCFLMNPEIPMLLGFNTPSLRSNLASVSAFVLVFLLVTASLSLIQLAIGLKTTPLVGFISVVGVLGLSALCSTPLLPGNYLMVARNSNVITNGFPSSLGAATALGLAVVALIAGAVICRRKDILGRRNEE